MDEKRQFFRIKNKGDILAQYETHALEVINISSSGVAVIKKNIHLPENGTIEITILNFLQKVKYEILKIESKTMVLVFKDEEDIDKLFLILKHLKDNPG